MSALAKMSILLITMQAGLAQQTLREIPTPSPAAVGAFAVSPDGKQIVYPVKTAGKSQLFLLSLETGRSKPLPGTDDILYPAPCWSPNGKAIVYYGGNALKKIDLENGDIQTLMAVPRVHGCTWNAEGTILFSAGTREIVRTADRPKAGVARATPMAANLAVSPHFLPDGQHFIYYVAGEGILVSNLEGAAPKRVLDADAGAIYSATGHILFVREQTLFGQRFDVKTLSVTGEPFVVTEPITPELFIPPVAVSAAGDLIYRTGLEGPAQRQFMWFDRAGKAVATVGKPLSLAGSPPVLSMDGRTILMDRAPDGNTNVWTMDVATGTLTRLTEGPGVKVFPLFSPDAQTVYYISNKTGVFELYERGIAGGEENLVIQRPTPRAPMDVSADGRYILYRGGNGVSAIQMDTKPRTEIPVVEKPPATGRANFPQFSPDGRWVVYQTPEEGRLEIFAQAFPTGRTIRITKNGGFWVRWRGKEIFFIAPDGKLMAVTVNLTDDPSTTTIGEPVALFEPPVNIVVADSDFGQPYFVSPDGQQFLIAAPIDVKSPLTVIRNWKP